MIRLRSEKVRERESVCVSVSPPELWLRCFVVCSVFCFSGCEKIIQRPGLTLLLPQQRRTHERERALRRLASGRLRLLLVLLNLKTDGTGWRWRCWRRTSNSSSFRRRRLSTLLTTAATAAIVGRLRLPDPLPQSDWCSRRELCER